MRMEIVRRIACEKDSSKIIPYEARSETQRARLTGLYELLVVLRILLTLTVQPGYVEQEEFSESIEVIAGDYFDLQTFKSPAFNSTFPTKSIALLHSTVYLPYLIFNSFLTYFHPLGKENVPNAKMMLLIPRIFYIMMSFLVDHLLIKFCALNHPVSPSRISDQDEDSDENSEDDSNDSSRKKNPNQGLKFNSLFFDVNNYCLQLVTLGSSQVMLIFSGRTHASVLNLLFYSAMLYCISKSFHAFEEYVPYLERYHDSEGAVHRARNFKRLKALGYSSVNNVGWISLLLTLSLFNDPEFFVSYCVVPLFFYMQRGISHPYVGMKFFHTRIFAILALCFIFSIPLILWDSFYYGKVTLDDFRELNLSPESFVVTPANYFARKDAIIDISHLFSIATQYLLTFNVLGVMGIVSFFTEIYRMLFDDWKDKPPVDSHWTFLNASLLLPLILMFFYGKPYHHDSSPFQMMPLLFPLIIMHGHKLPLVSKFSKSLGATWFLCNILGILFWGYLNDSGLLTSLFDINDSLVPIRFNSTHADVILSHISTIPPTFLLVIPSFWKVRIAGETKTILRRETTGKLRVFMTGESNLPLYHWENNIVRILDTKDIEDKIDFLIIPTKTGKLAETEFKQRHIELVKVYWNHVHFARNKLTESSHWGLSVYKISKKGVTKKPKNEEKEASSPFDLLSWNNILMNFYNSFILVATLILFIASYVVFLT